MTAIAMPPPVRHGQWALVGRNVWDLLCTALLCVLFQLVIWVLRLFLKQGLDFLSPILGMMLVFAVTTLLHSMRPGTERVYETHIINKVDLLNRNLGVCFAIPLIQVSKGPLLPGGVIGKIVGTFIITNLISWPVVFLMASAWQILLSRLCDPFRAFRLLLGATAKTDGRRRSSTAFLISQPGLKRDASSSDMSNLAGSGSGHSAAPTLVDMDRTVAGNCHGSGSDGSSSSGGGGGGIPNRTPPPNGPTYSPLPQSPRPVRFLPDGGHPVPAFPGGMEVSFVLPLPAISPRPRTHGAVGISLLCLARLRASPSENRLLHLACGRFFHLLLAFAVVIVGIPIAAALAEDRPLDLGFLFLVWLGAIEIQQLLLKIGLRYRSRRWLPAVVNTATTLANPVLLTTFAMICYTLLKAHARSDWDRRATLAVFSSGTSASALMSYRLGLAPLPPGRADWFGAGDAALAILECGIVAWGFKLYECRRQLWSPAGFATVATSACAALFNIFVSVLVAGRGLALPSPEALAFAARSTTLALSRPAMDALGGNMVVNAAVVVFNGILGQCLYPHVPRLLGIAEGQGAAAEVEEEEEQERREELQTAAAGVTVGVNGAAMGVAYLCSHRAGAAPFAALTMAMFGVMTVVFTCVEQFSSVVKDLVA